ncbi:MAG: NAD(P)H-dependent oxidoreductase [Oscillospiraceae bacterium]|nr:NAD(P)H-dependent oxidoreductase [Oscillospiraceae bacterium]
MSKILVAYFSASGVTAKVAKELAKAEHADLFEIKPEEPYTTEDLDWTNKQSRSTLEMSDPDCRPKIVGTVADMAQYDAIFVGFPIWWGREPSVVDTFLDGYNFGGKTLVPFCTSGGSGICRTAERIRTIVGTGVSVDEGKRLGGAVSEKDLALWTEGLQL